MDEGMYTVRYADDKPRIKLKVEKMTKGYNWEVAIDNIVDADAGQALLDSIVASMGRTYGTPPPG